MKGVFSCFLVLWGLIVAERYVGDGFQYALLCSTYREEKDGVELARAISKCSRSGVAIMMTEGFAAQVAHIVHLRSSFL